MSKLTFLMVIFIVTISCNHDDSPSLNTTEGKLLGEWRSSKVITAIPGQPAVEFIPDMYSYCFMEFTKRPAPLINSSSPVYSNTKFVQDNKDCNWLANAWKIEKNGKLLLASLDTVYADILKLSEDSLVLKIDFDNYYGPENTHFVATKTYFLTR